MSSPPPKNQIDRQTTTPFHLKLFYKLHGYHHLSDFPITNPTAGPSSTAPPPLPQHLQIYTWQSCTLRELTHLLTTALPTLLPDPAVGTRLSFRLVFPDTRPLRPGATEREREEHANRPGRYLSKELGSVILGPDKGDDDEDDGARNGTRGVKVGGEEADKTLMDARFVIGDYVDCAIYPAGADGAAPPSAGGPRGSVGGGNYGYGRGGAAVNGRENGFYGRGGPRGAGRGGFTGRDGPGAGGPGAGGVPMGEWRRGERLPDSGGFGGGRGGYRGGRGRGGY